MPSLSESQGLLPSTNTAIRPALPMLSLCSSFSIKRGEFRSHARLRRPSFRTLSPGGHDDGFGGPGVQLPAPMLGSSQVNVTPAPGDLAPALGSRGHQHPYTRVHSYTQLHIVKNKATPPPNVAR